MTDEEILKESNGEGSDVSITLVKAKPKPVKKVDPNVLKLKALLSEVAEHLRAGRYVKASDALSRSSKVLNKM